MNSDTEKALLDVVAALVRLEWAPSSAGERRVYWCDFDEKARAYLATLEPKPEPKRGVEDWLESVALTVEEATPGVAADIRTGIRLYREERDRAAREGK